MTKLINAAQVQELTGLSPGVVSRMVKEGEFPPPVYLSKVRRAWPADEVENWIVRRIRERRHADAS